MKKITVILSDKAEKYLNEVIYSLDDGDGKVCTQSKAINYILEASSDFEENAGTDILGYLNDLKI